mmetsp:Transcript_25047/g.53380  ORF Transcript_25047/g.53380 Transcript_25047/m.53380 type:complete len:269 (+) Transcript_25047:218-1024(+)
MRARIVPGKAAETETATKQKFPRSLPPSCSSPRSERIGRPRIHRLSNRPWVHPPRKLWSTTTPSLGVISEQKPFSMAITVLFPSSRPICCRAASATVMAATKKMAARMDISPRGYGSGTTVTRSSTGTPSTIPLVRRVPMACGGTAHPPKTSPRFSTGGVDTLIATPTAAAAAPPMVAAASSFTLSRRPGKPRPEVAWIGCPWSKTNGCCSANPGSPVSRLWDWNRKPISKPSAMEMLFPRRISSGLPASPSLRFPRPRPSFGAPIVR